MHIIYNNIIIYNSNSDIIISNNIIMLFYLYINEWFFRRFGLNRSFGKCCLSAIKKTDNENRLLSSSSVNSIDDPSEKPIKSFDLTIMPTNQDQMDIETPKPPDDEGASNMNVRKNYFSPTVERKNRSDSGNNHCTTVEPFSFESREKCKQAHRKARRERVR